MRYGRGSKEVIVQHWASPDSDSIMKTVAVLLFAMALSHQAKGTMDNDAYVSRPDEMSARVKRESNKLLREVREAIEDGKRTAMKEYDTALTALSSMDPECRAKSLTGVYALRGNSFWGFITCLNFTRLSMDLGDTVVDTIATVNNFTGSLDGFLGNFSRCEQGDDVWARITCFINMMKSIQDLVAQQMSVFENLIINYGNAIEDIKNTIKQCIKGDSVNKEKLLSIMEPALHCNKSISVSRRIN